jgi:hypothetical protein
MPTTSGGIRYPASTDAINIPLDMANLANDVQTYIDTNALTTSGTYTLTNKTIGSTGLFFEGATDNGFETLLTVVDPTADNTITLPDATGTVALLTATQIFSNKAFNTSFAVNGASSGAATIQAPSAAGTPTLTLPTVSGTIALVDDIAGGEMLVVMGVYGG